MPLLKAVDPFYDQVGTQSTRVPAEGGEGSVRRDEEWQDVEPVIVGLSKRRPFTDSRHDAPGCRRCPPIMAIDKRMLLLAEAALMAQESRVGSRGDESPAAIKHLHNSIALDAL